MIHYFRRYPFRLIKLIKGRKQVVSWQEAIDGHFVLESNVKDGVLSNQHRARPMLKDPYNTYFCEDWKHDVWTHEQCKKCKAFDTYYDGYDIGLLCGKINHIVVIDNDTGKSLREFRQYLANYYGPLPDTWTSQTRSGGHHFFYRYQGDLPSDISSFIPGVDIIANNRWVALPPFQGYSWIIPPLKPPAELPPWIINLKLKKLRKSELSMFMSNPNTSERDKVLAVLARWSITSVNHDDWIAVGKSLASNGLLKEFVDWCQLDTDKKRIINSKQIRWFESVSGFGLGLFFNIAKKNGISF